MALIAGFGGLCQLFLGRIMTFGTGEIGPLRGSMPVMPESVSNPVHISVALPAAAVFVAGDIHMVAFHAGSLPAQFLFVEFMFKYHQVEIPVSIDD